MKDLYKEGKTSIVLDEKTGAIVTTHDGMTTTLFNDGNLLVKVDGQQASEVISIKKKPGTEGELDGDLEIRKHIHPYGWVACALIPKMV